jgi:hypothetical protein
MRYINIPRSILQLATLWSLSAIAAVAMAAPISAFDLGAEGWKAANLLISPFYTNPPGIVAVDDAVWSGVGGNPGGNISWTDVDGNYFTFAAPAAFLGDQHVAYGGSLVFDMKVTDSDGDVLPGAILVGGGLTLFRDFGPPGSDWTTVTVPLSEAGWYDSDGNPVTQQDLQQTLGALQAIYLTGDWFTGTETASLDNVRLTAVPEPSESLLLATGVLGLLLLAPTRARRC